MPGRLVDVGWGHMHIACTGDAGPTVILDSGLGDSFIEWKKVQEGVSEFAQVCSYDRAGMGYSDSSPGPRDSTVFAQELHDLLHRAGLTPPYILVGHSMAAFDIRLYQSLYQSDVAGLVFVDGSHPDQWKRLPPALQAINTKSIWEAKIWQYLTPIGVARTEGYCGDDPEIRAVECTYNDARETAEEHSSFSESGAEVKRMAAKTMDIPVLVISHDPEYTDPDLPPYVNRDAERVWSEMQNDLTKISAKGSQVIAARSGHYIQNDRPDVVIGAIHAMVGETQAAAPQQP
jgi:pimeloyl-ACP methyl ester carboxylesterase